jgi:hypothetical protein
MRLPRSALLEWIEEMKPSRGSGKHSKLKEFCLILFVLGSKGALNKGRMERSRGGGGCFWVMEEEEGWKVKCWQSQRL